MKGGKLPHGYTIVEALIFLAVSAVMFTSAVRLISGQQNKAQFNQGVQEIESRLRDIINDVATGYYPPIGNISCTANTPTGSGITINYTSNQGQGKNAGCIFIGKALHFVPAGETNNRELIRIYTVAGQRQEAAGRETTALNNSGATALNATGTYEDYRLPGGLSVQGVTYNTPPSQEPLGMFGIFNTFVTYSGNNLSSGSTTSDLVVIPTTSFNQDTSSATSTLKNRLSFPPVANPTSGVTICLRSSTTNQYALIRVGSENRQSSVKLEIKSGNYTAGDAPLCAQ